MSRAAAPHPTLLLIDGHAVLHRAYHALPPLTTPSGMLVNAVYGFATILLKALADFAPTHVAVAFDAGGETFRHALFAKYQAQREEKPDELYAQIAPIKKMLAAFRVPVFEREGIEADDLIGTIVEQVMRGQSKIENRKSKILILTGDKDLLQLVDDRVEVVLLRRGVSEVGRYNPAAVVERFGFPPERIRDFKALAGDPSDNYPGVPGIGEKTATALVQAFGGVEEIIAAANRRAGVHPLPPKRAGIPLRSRELRKDAVKPAPTPDAAPLTEKLAAKLRDHADDARLGLQLSTIQRDVPIDFSFDACVRQPADHNAAVTLFRELGFTSLIGRIPGSRRGGAASPPASVDAGTPMKPPRTPAGGHAGPPLRQQPAPPDTLTSPADFSRLSPDLAAADRFAFLIESDEGSPRTSHPRAIGFAWDDHAVVAQPWDAALAATAAAFRSDAPKVTHDAKAARHALARARVPLNGRCDDTMLMHYLLAPGSRSHELEQVAMAELGVAAGFSPPSGSGDLSASGGSAEGGKVAATTGVRAIASLAPLLRTRLDAEGLTRVYEDIDLPLVPVLQRMEWQGIRLDTDALTTLSRDMHTALDATDARIFTHAKHTFSVDSPKQLKVVLFEELGLAVRGLKKTAKGNTLSTAAAELEKLRGAHPIIEDILTHRELHKLLSTYVDALPQLVDPTTGRIHTTFHQTVAATGRLSSSDPNLQNIPVSEPWGPAIRRAFIAEDEWQLLALDYSQFELRIAAALSGDRTLTAAFHSKQDIHAATGAAVFGVEAADVTKDQRRVAKAINFGILYGMGAGSLAQTAGISRPEAEEYISRYFAAYRELHEWIEQTKALAASRGFVETLFGRKRYLPELQSGVPAIRAAAERMAVNMPVQGTQADLVKMAMVAADRWTRSANQESVGQEHTAPGVIPNNARNPVQLLKRDSSSLTSRNDIMMKRIRMLLTVHDELVFEVREDFVAEAATSLRDILENIHKLPVPIVVEARVGKSWGEMTRIPS